MALLLCFLRECTCSLRVRNRRGVAARLATAQPDGADVVNGSVTFQIPLERSDQNWYVAHLKVGDNNVRLAVDTASGELWVPQADMPLPDDPFAATTAKQPSFVVHYGRGAVSGTIATGDVTIGDVVQKCDFGGADHEDAWWQKQSSIDGVWGLSCDGGGVSGFAGFGKMRRLLNCLQEDKRLQRRIITLQLTDTGGMMSIGGTPDELQGGMVKMLPMQGCDHWQVPLVQISIGGSGSDSGKQYAEGGSWAMLDSGATGVVGPSAAVAQLASDLGAEASDVGAAYGGGLQSYTVKCDQQASLPNVTLSLGSQSQMPVTVVMSQQNLVRGCHPEGAPDCHCKLSFTGWQTESWILGGAFLRNVRGVSLDFDTGAVGIAP